MTDHRVLVQAAADAIAALDDAAFAWQGDDRRDFEAARKSLWAIMERHGYEIAVLGTSRIRKAAGR